MKNIHCIRSAQELSNFIAFWYRNWNCISTMLKKRWYLMVHNDIVYMLSLFSINPLYILFSKPTFYVWGTKFYCRRQTHYAFKLKINFSINIIVLSEWWIKRRKYAEAEEVVTLNIFMTSLDDNVIKSKSSFTIELQLSWFIEISWTSPCVFVSIIRQLH